MEDYDDLGVEIYEMPLQELKWWSRNFIFKEVMDNDDQW
jgi:hypothetical protein